MKMRGANGTMWQRMALAGLLACGVGAGCSPGGDGGAGPNLGSGPGADGDSDGTDDGADDGHDDGGEGDDASSADGDTTGLSCEVGTEDCTCAAGGSCTSGLSCEGDLCVPCEGEACAACGDATCDPSEDCATCPDDCACEDACGDRVCDADAGESCATCPTDCTCETDPCDAAASGDGPYCGETIGGTAETLYVCTGSSTTSSTPCTDGCAQCPAGTADVCKTDPGQSDAEACAAGVDPCASAMYGDGPYCGESIGATAETLYICTGGVTTGMLPCDFECAQCDPFVADVCKAFAGQTDDAACG